MATTENVIVEGVTVKPTGWADISLKDGRTASSRHDGIIAAAKEAAGTGAELPAEINTVPRDGFPDNHYLNKLGDVSDTRTNGSSKGKAATGGGAKRSFGKSPEEQKTIQLQWAFGRATELYMGLGEYTMPLTEDQRAALAEMADWYFNEVKKRA